MSMSSFVYKDKAAAAAEMIATAAARMRDVSRTGKCPRAISLLQEVRALLKASVVVARDLQLDPEDK